MDRTADSFFVRSGELNKNAFPDFSDRLSDVGNWTIAIDYGSSFTCAVMSGDGTPEVLEIDNSRYLPSVVCLDEDGALLTGRDAAQEAAIHPQMAELQPKRALVADAVTRLGDRDVSTVEIVAATLRRVVEEATLRRGRPPSRAVLTHPAAWTDRETTRLAEAAVKAGLPAPEFLPEPVAAAVHHATGANVPAGAHIAVYDLGGGTFDTAVLRRTATGFELCGPPGGDPDFGGADVSEALREVVGAQVRHEAATEWDALWSDESIRGQQRRASQLGYLTQAKESLSGRTVVMVPVHAADTQVRITRAELEAAIEDSLRPTVDELVRTVEAAGIAVADLKAVYLTGGSSRIPRVSELIAERTGLLPVAEGDPKAVVCLGALRAVTDPPPAAPAPSPEPAPAPEPVTEPMAEPVAEPVTERFDPVTLPMTPAVPPPPPPAAPGRRPGWFNRGRIILVAGVALLVTGITATAAAALIEEDDEPIAEPTPVVTTTTPAPAVTTTTPEAVIYTVDPEVTSPSPTPTYDEVEEEPTPTVRDALSPGQQELYDRVDFDSLDADACEEWAPGTAGVEAAISCNSSGAVLDKQVGVIQFDDNDSMNAYMDGEFTRAVHEGQCSEGNPFKGTWNTDGVVQGRMACYWMTIDGDDYFKVTWSFVDHSIVAAVYDQSATTAGEWWSSNSHLVSE
jgi:actin-like ATPase involved in cell morphogenesis